MGCRLFPCSCVNIYSQSSDGFFQCSTDCGQIQVYNCEAYLTSDGSVNTLYRRSVAAETTWYRLALALTQVLSLFTLVSGDF